MSTRFDALAKGIAEGTTRRQALKLLVPGVPMPGAGERAKFDELAKRLTSPVARRSMLKWFTVTFVASMFGPLRFRWAWAMQCPSGTVACGAVCCSSSQICSSGSCVNCPPGQAACNGVCCPPGLACANGVCGTCPTGQVACSGQCVNLANDPAHCGTCATVCPPGTTCVSGACASCASGLTPCSGVCVDLQSDPQHCGSCATNCASYGTGLHCVNGQCVGCPDNQVFCGAICCPPGGTCNNGVCSAPTAVGPGGASALAIRAIEPNPAVGQFNVSFTLATGERADLEILDVSGRRMVSRSVGSFGPGSHTLRLGRSAGLRPGVYLVRLTQGDAAVVAKAAIVN